MKTLGQINATLKSGKEKFKIDGETIGLNLIDFWKWSVSDLLSNATRGRLAEFIVGSAVGCDLQQVRDEWAECDLITPKGIRLEIKSSAYLQSWAQKEFSKIIFSIKTSKSWNGETGKFIGIKTRPSDYYIFCVLKHKDQDTIDPLDLNQWVFYVLPTSILNDKFRNASSMSLSILEKLTDPIDYNQLNSKINNS